MALFSSTSTDIFTSLSAGNMEFLLPFFFVFGITFALLTSAAKSAKIGAFENRAVNALISIVLGFLAAGSDSFRVFFFRNGPAMVLVFVGLFVLAFVLEVLGLRSSSERKKLREANPVMMIILGGLGLLVLLSLGFFGNLSFIPLNIPVIGTANLFMAVGLLLVIMMFVFAYQQGKKGGE